jgi:hypothetical protein
MSRERMQTEIDTRDLLDPAEAVNVMDPQCDYEAIAVEVDCDMSRPDRSVGFLGGAELCEVVTERGRSVEKMLTPKAVKRLKHEYEAWFTAREQDRADAAMDARESEYRDSRR